MNRCVHILDMATHVPRSLPEVFAFFSDASNLERITPPELLFELATPSPIEMKVGSLIDYRLRLFGVPFSWRTRIAAWEPCVKFVDEQLKGPYAKLQVHRIFAYRTRRIAELLGPE